MNVISPAEELELFQLIADAQTTNYLAGEPLQRVKGAQLTQSFCDVAAGITLLLLNSSGKAVLACGVWVRYVTLIVLCFTKSCSEKWSQLVEMVTCTLMAIGVDLILVMSLDVVREVAKIAIYPHTVAHRLTFGSLTTLPRKCWQNGWISGKPRSWIFTVATNAHTGRLFFGAVTRLFTFYAVPYFLMAVTMLSMTLYKCGQHLHATGLKRSRMPVITLFLRDGVFLFATILLLVTVEIILWHNGRPSLAEVPPALNAVVGARILLNIKNLVNDSNNTAPSIELSTGSVGFRHPRVVQKGRIPWYLQTGEPSGIDSANSGDS
ncbi:hypothetical protein DFH09DRAFT_1087008 [Mycena vulgaris]|nr:hypothetical protein DFH09DRAFT_1087008 [Mycena vulgaris]